MAGEPLLQRARMVERSQGGMTVPQIFIGSTHVGGCDDLYALNDAGGLDPLLADDGTSAMTPNGRPSA